MGYSAEQLSSLGVELGQEAEKRKSQLRLLGGIAVFFSSHQAAHKSSLRRDYKDLDFAVNRKGVRALGEVFIAQGWEEDRYFNALHGQDRMLFYYHEELQAGYLHQPVRTVPRAQPGEPAGFERPYLTPGRSAADQTANPPVEC